MNDRYSPATEHIHMPIRFANIMQEFVEEVTLPLPAPDGSTAVRRMTLIPVNGVVKNPTELASMMQDFRGALAEFTPVLVDGFGQPRLQPWEPFTASSQEWLVQRLDELWSGRHAWCRHLPKYATVDEMWRSGCFDEYGSGQLVIGARYGAMLFVKDGEARPTVPVALVELARLDPQGHLVETLEREQYRISVDQGE